MPELTYIEADHRARSINHEIDRIEIACRCGYRATMQLTDSEIESAERLPSISLVAGLFDEHMAEVSP